MNQPDKWTSTEYKGLTLGSNSMLGTPRSWINRAMCNKNPDLNLASTTLHPREVSVGGVWFKPCVLPDTGSSSAIYRFFDFDTNFHSRGRSVILQPAIGMGVAVPAAEIMQTLKIFTASGAKWTWWAWPEPRPNGEPKITSNADINHAELYKLFDQGFTIPEVVIHTGHLKNSVAYVYKKWSLGKPALKTRGRYNGSVDHQAVLEDLKTGLFTVQEVADRNDTTRTTVWSIRKKYETA